MIGLPGYQPAGPVFIPDPKNTDSCCCDANVSEGDLRVQILFCGSALLGLQVRSGERAIDATATRLRSTRAARLTP